MALSTSRTVLTQTGINTFLNYDIGGLNSAGIATFSNFKTGTSDVHSSGYNVGTGLTVRANYIGLTGDVSATGVITATSFVGSGANLTGVASTDNIKTSTTANFSDGIQVGGSTTLTGALSATTATANVIVVGSAVTSNSQGIDVTGVVTATTVKVGSAISFTDGAVSATRFHGDGSQLTGIDADKISEGNTKAEVIDTGSNGHFVVDTEGVERFRIAPDGKIGIGTNNPSNFVTIESAGNVQLLIDSNATSGNTDECGVLFAASGTSKSHFGLSVDPARGVADATADDTFIKTIGTNAIRLATDSTTRCVIEGSTGITNFQKAVGIGSYTTTQRNAIAYLQAGTLIFNNTTGTVQVWDGGAWTNLTEPFSASGGTKTTSGSKTIHTFTSNGTFTVASNATNVRALIVGGGGGGGGRGGNDGSGGGGGGLVRFVTGIPVSPSPGSYPIVIGGGGASRGPGTNGGDGGSSSAFSNTCPGGGGGGSEAPGPRAGRPGGCGGGGGGYGGGGGTGDGDPGAPTDADNAPHTTPSNGWGNDGGAN